MTDEIRQAKNEYLREWRKKNKEKTKKYNADYWKRRVEKSKKEN
jgi:hypothetical protein